MNKRVLAQQFRERQYAHGEVSREVIDSVSDDSIIEAYITCSCCGEKLVSPEELTTAIAQATDCIHFFEICDLYTSLKTSQIKN